MRVGFNDPRDTAPSFIKQNEKILDSYRHVSDSLNVWNHGHVYNIGEMKISVIERILQLSQIVTKNEIKFLVILFSNSTPYKMVKFTVIV